MIFRRTLVLVFLCGSFLSALRAETPPLLAKAIEQWTAGLTGLAFTQQTRIFFDDGTVKEERIERFDPSLPDSRRWRLIEVDGHPATEAQREKWESRKNRKPRKQITKSPGDYLDLEHAKLVASTAKTASFEIGMRPEAARLLAVEKIAIIISVDKESGGIGRIVAKLREPIRVLLGFARITDLDIDVRMELADEDSVQKSGDVKTGSTARVTMSKMGDAMEYNWSDFKRVVSFSGKPASSNGAAAK